MLLVRVALNRPYTFIVLALLILILSPVLIVRTPTDIFPNIHIPVIAVAWQFTGLNPEEMEGRFTTAYERVLTTTVDNIEHIESTTVNGQAQLVPITLGRDYGSMMEVVSGLQPTDQVIANPADSLISGTPVRVNAQQQTHSTPQLAGGPTR